MRRRQFIGLIGGAAASPLVARAQQPEHPARIGFLPQGLASNSYDQSLVEALRQGMRKVGLIENRNVTIDIVWVSKEPDFAQAVRELVQRGAKLLITAGSSASAAANQYTSTIPIIFVSVGNPVGIGLVKGLSHPGGNATGLTDVLGDLSSKYLDFALQLGKPQAPVFYLWHTEWPDGQRRLQATERAAQSVGAALQSRGIRDIDEVNDVLVSMKSDGALVILVQPSPFTYRHRSKIIDSAMNHSLGTIFSAPNISREGALIAYGPDFPYMYRRVGAYVEQILAGVKPADLPVEEPTKFELVINLNSARALGLAIPPTLLALANEVIE
jgi:putative tryptophan/tyrosine transport system substrate-binding protein